MTLNVRIPSKASDFLINEAARLSCRPDQLAVALISCVADASMTDAVLDGADPKEFVPSRAAGLQVRVLRALATFKVPNGSSFASYAEIATYLGLHTRGCVHAAIKSLAAKDMVLVIKTGTPGDKSRYRLTEKAELLLKELGR